MFCLYVICLAVDAFRLSLCGGGLCALGALIDGPIWQQPRVANRALWLVTDADNIQARHVCVVDVGMLEAYMQYNCENRSLANAASLDTLWQQNAMKQQRGQKHPNNK